MQNNWEIVRVSEEQVGEIVAIERATFTLPWSAESFISEIQNPDSYFTAAVADGHAVGFCVLRYYEDEGEILNIAVSEGYRSNGIGHGLISDALSYADCHGVKRVFLEVRKSNWTAISLYAKNGFQPISVRRNYYDQPVEDALIMAREIF